MNEQMTVGLLAQFCETKNILKKSATHKTNQTTQEVKIGILSFAHDKNSAQIFDIKAKA